MVKAKLSTQPKSQTMPKQKYIILDSAGIRKQSKRTTGAESFAVLHTYNAMKDADVICMVVDGSSPITKQDKLIASMASETGKGIVVLANKADLVDKTEKIKFEERFYKELDFLKVKKFIWVSARELLEAQGLEAE